MLGSQDQSLIGSTTTNIAFTYVCNWYKMPYLLTYVYIHIIHIYYFIEYLFFINLIYNMICQLCGTICHTSNIYLLTIFYSLGNQPLNLGCVFERYTPFAELNLNAVSGAWSYQSIYKSYLYQ